MIEDFGPRVTSAWNDLRSATRTLLERAWATPTAGAGPQAARSAPYDPRADRELSQLLSALDERAREATDNEKLANFIFWREIGRRMNIQNIPDTLEAFEQFNRDYERDYFRYTESNHQVAKASVGVFVEGYPRPLRPLAQRVIYALMDDALLEAVGLRYFSPSQTSSFVYGS
jgi:hypothetical protein